MKALVRLRNARLALTKRTTGTSRNAAYPLVVSMF